MKKVKNKYSGLHWRLGYQSGRFEILKVVEDLIVAEILIAQKEEQRTSRLTSLIMRIKELT